RLKGVGFEPTTSKSRVATSKLRFQVGVLTTTLFAPSQALLELLTMGVGFPAPKLLGPIKNGFYPWALRVSNKAN
ncbi:hypothetical protein MaudMau93_008116, partial [Microsporum audouinii]